MGRPLLDKVMSLCGCLLTHKGLDCCFKTHYIPIFFEWFPFPICRCSCFQLESPIPPRDKPTLWAWWWREEGCQQRLTVSGFCFRFFKLGLDISELHNSCCFCFLHWHISLVWCQECRKSFAFVFWMKKKSKLMKIGLGLGLGLYVLIVRLLCRTTHNAAHFIITMINMRNQPSLLNSADTNIVWCFQVLCGQQHLGPVWEMVLLRGPWNPARSSHQRVSCLLQIRISPDVPVSIFQIVDLFSDLWHRSSAKQESQIQVSFLSLISVFLLKLDVIEEKYVSKWNML